MAADKDFNPMGTRGFEFVEFTGPDVSALTRVFQSLGFAPVAMHRSKNVTLFRQGGINFILNGEGKGFPKDFRDQHGPPSAPSRSASTTRRRRWPARRSWAPKR